MHERGVLKYIDAVGVHGFPGQRVRVARAGMREVGRCAGAARTSWASKPQVWITQTGFSTWRGDERAQVRAFVDALDAPVERVYWQSRLRPDPQPPRWSPSTPMSASITMD